MARINRIIKLLVISLFSAKALARSTACAEIDEIYAKWHENGGSSI